MTVSALSKKMAVAELAAAIRTSAADFATTIVPVLTTLGWAPTATDVGKMSLELAFREALFAVMGVRVFFFFFHSLLNIAYHPPAGRLDQGQL